MDNQFGHPTSESLLEGVANLFKKKKIFASQDRHIIFVCGGNGRRSMRVRFMKYARTEISSMRMFLAESAAEDLLTQGEPAPLEVADFEDLIADVSDCVLIFPESYGSIAEVAYFCRSEKICSKILVVGNTKLQAKDSFINLGPIAIINGSSIFRPAIQADYTSPDFSVIRERLKQRVPGSGRKSFEYRPFPDLTAKFKFFVLFEIIRIFGVINLNGVQKCVHAAFGTADVKEVKRLLSILCAAGYVTRLGIDNQYLCLAKKGVTFLQYSKPTFDSLTTRVADYYRKYESTAFTLLARVTR